MAVDKIKHNKPASRRTFLDELEPIPYTITPGEIAAMTPRMQEILFGIKPVDKKEKPYSPPPIPEDVEEPELHLEEDAVSVETPAPETEEEFDYLRLATFADAPSPHITLIFPAEEEEKDLVDTVRSLADYKGERIEGRLWHAARFFRNDSEKLKRINEYLQNREGIFTLMNGKRTRLGRSLYLPLMYIFSAGKYV